MKIFFTAAEYDPFHLGHAYHVEQARARGATHIAAVMSGNFVQRGEPAVFPKSVRAAAAVMGGVDLVLELPVVWSLAPAQRFAAGCVDIALASGVADGFTFGCETAEPDRLISAARLLCKPETQDRIRSIRRESSYPAAVFAACSEIAPDILSSPNNILAIEYIKTLVDRQSDLPIFPVERRFAAHDAAEGENGFCSAMHLRSMLAAGESFLSHVPERAAPVFEKALADEWYIPDASFYSRQLLAGLRRCGPEALTLVHGGRGGLAERFTRAVRTATAPEELFALTKSKRFTLAGIRRFAWCAFLGIREETARRSPPYLRVLAFNRRGAEILREMRKKASLPILMKKSDADPLDSFGKKVYALECAATDQYNTFLKTVRPCGTEMTDNIFIDGVKI